VSKQTLEKFAVKKIPKLKFSGERKLLDQLLQEASLLAKLEHKNIVRLIQFFDEEKFFYIVLE